MKLVESNNYKNYLEDCLEVLLERAKEASDEAHNTNTDFDKGRALGYYETLTYLLNQLEFFQIKVEMIGSIKEHLPLRL